MNGYNKNTKKNNKRKYLNIKTTPLYLAMGMICSQAIPVHAAVIADINQGNIPTIKANSNGSLTVNINSASNSGISHNKFTQFDVTQSGLVLNNSANGSTTTVTGNVAGNKNMTNGSASLIINEVTQNRPSRLNGLVEVAGGKANVIISNPAGITCDGCGFVNTKSSTLTTGKPIIDNNNFAGINVSNGTITVTGRGMNDNADFTTLLARAVKINADLRASDLQINTGFNENVPFKDGKIVNTGTSGTISTLADMDADIGIDVSSLGGMYANKITLISVGQNLGVNNKGLISSDTEMSINSNGVIKNNGTFETNSGDMRLIATEINNNFGTISSEAGDITLSSEYYIKNQQGRIVNKGSILTNSFNVDNSSGLFSGDEISIVAGSIQNNGGIIQGKEDVNLNSNSTLESIMSTIVSDEGSISLTSNENINLDNAFVYAREKDVIINAGMLGALFNPPGLNDTIIKANDITFNVGLIGTFSKDTQISANHDIIFNRPDINQGGAFINNGTLNAENDINITKGPHFRNSGVFSAGNNINLNVFTLDNENLINAAGSTNLSASFTFYNGKNANIISGKKTTLSSPGITNNGNIIAYSGLDVSSNYFTNNGYIYGEVTQTPYE